MMKAGGLLPLLASALVLTCLAATAIAAPGAPAGAAITCNQQTPCLDFTYECVDSQYEICMTLDTANPSCVVDDACTRSIGYVCLVSPSSILGALTYGCDPDTCSGSCRTGLPTGLPTGGCKVNSPTSGTRLCQRVDPGRRQPRR